MDWSEVAVGVVGGLILIGLWIAIQVLGGAAVRELESGLHAHQRPSAGEAAEQLVPDEGPQIQTAEELDQAIASLLDRIRELERTGGSGTTIAQAALTRHRSRLAELQHRRQLLREVSQPWSAGGERSEGIRPISGEIQPDKVEASPSKLSIMPDKDQ
jgi:hypothetical protein